MKWPEDGEDLFAWCLGVLAIVAAIMMFVAAGFGISVLVNDASAKDACGARGGTVSYSPEPHQKDWRCIGASAERAP